MPYSAQQEGRVSQNDFILFFIRDYSLRFNTVMDQILEKLVPLHYRDSALWCLGTVQQPFLNKFILIHFRFITLLSHAKMLKSHGPYRHVISQPPHLGFM